MLVIKGELAGDESVEDHAQRPDIGSEAVVGLALRRKVGERRKGNGLVTAVPADCVSVMYSP